nr:MAG TPA: hypothetical protein [Caudoviricetes sp.]DAN63485.1 MAG TPA: hypothetical protein [Caudoviricetes sp.]
MYSGDLRYSSCFFCFAHSSYSFLIAFHFSTHSS